MSTFDHPGCVNMGGGPALMYAAEAVKAWDDLQAAQD